MSTLSKSKLTAAELKERLADFPGWSIENSMLCKQFEFPTYSAGVVFVSGAAVFAEQLDHHPDILLTYRKAKISLSTHDADGITEFDFELAKRIETLA